MNRDNEMRVLAKDMSMDILLARYKDAFSPSMSFEKFPCIAAPSERSERLWPGPPGRGEM